MPTIDELRLARAKALAWSDMKDAVIYASAEELWLALLPDDRDDYRRHACAIEASDAAMGVVSVPIKLTPEMRGGSMRGGYYSNLPHPEQAQMAGEADDFWEDMLAANPLRETKP